MLSYFQNSVSFHWLIRGLWHNTRWFFTQSTIGCLVFSIRVALTCSILVVWTAKVLKAPSFLQHSHLILAWLCFATPLPPDSPKMARTALKVHDLHFQCPWCLQKLCRTYQVQTLIHLVTDKSCLTLLYHRTASCKAWYWGPTLLQDETQLRLRQKDTLICHSCNAEDVQSFGANKTKKSVACFSQLMYGRVCNMHKLRKSDQS